MVVACGVMIEEEKEGLYVNRRRRGGDEMMKVKRELVL